MKGEAATVASFRELEKAGGRSLLYHSTCTGQHFVASAAAMEEELGDAFYYRVLATMLLTQSEVVLTLCDIRSL